MRLGSEKTRNLSERLRYIWLRGITGELLHLATNLPPDELSGSDAALLYKSLPKLGTAFIAKQCQGAACPKRAL